MDLRYAARVGGAGIALVVAFTTLAAPASGQLRPGLTVAAGPSPYDLSGTGTGLVVGAAADLPVTRHFVVESSLRYFRYTPQSVRGILSGTQVISRRTPQPNVFLFPEMTVQFQLPLGRVHPYLGAGAGAALVVDGPGDEELTLHGAAGARVALGGRWNVRPEFRLRSVDPFTGSMGDVTLGLRYSF